jgi:N-acylneuraminate cytidylyltransferase
MRLAVIPARGGSKRIPRKNIRNFCGKPIIAWSIEAALKSGCFDHVIVSTDDCEIAEVAQQYGAKVPFIRPIEISDDFTGTIPVICHAINWHIQHGLKPIYVCCIYATAPLLMPVNIFSGMQQMLEKGSEYVFSATKYPFPIQRAIRLTNNMNVSMLSPENFNTRSQDLEEVYHDAGQFYWGRTSAWLSGKAIFGNNSSAILLPKYRVMDIDTSEDWVMAEYLFKVINLERENLNMGASIKKFEDYKLG